MQQGFTRMPKEHLLEAFPKLTLCTQKKIAIPLKMQTVILLYTKKPLLLFLSRIFFLFLSSHFLSSLLVSDLKKNVFDSLFSKQPQHYFIAFHCTINSKV